MNLKVEAMNKANAQGWGRARKLCEQVEDTNTNQARGFLSENKKGPYPGILDNGKLDKRNPVVRQMIEEFTKYCKTHKGVIGRKPDNGETPKIPVASPSVRTGSVQTLPVTHKEKANRLDMNSLVKIKQLSDELGSLQNLEEGIKIIKTLQIPT